MTAAAGGEIPLLVGAAGIALLLGVAVSLFLARRLKREPFGLELDEIAAMLRKVQLIAVGRESLLRVTELVARGVPMAEVLPAIAQGVGRLADAEEARVYRYEADGSLVRVATWGESTAEAGQVAAAAIVLHGRQWGRVTVTVAESVPVRNDLDEVLAAFAGVAAIAISNAQARDELAASRKRVDADEARRKIERDLHDGTEQRLVTLALQLDELGEISHGVHPGILSQVGLRPALRSLARRAALPVRLRVEIPGRLPQPLEIAAYYVVSEALANATKYSGASTVEVDVAVHGGTLAVRVFDDGAGGVDETKGSGIVGLRDRVEALGGTITVASPTDEGTIIRANIPVGVPEPEASSVT